MTLLLTTTDTIPLQIDAEGVMRVGRTRVTLDTLVAAFNEGATAEEMAQQYPSVALADIYSVIGYYLRRRSEVEAYLRERQTLATEAQRQNEARLSPVGLRARLLARQGQPGR
jgi:uncharacterized protein (DUF433 family)